MIDFITRFVDYLRGAGTWQFFAFCAVAFCVLGIIGLFADNKRRQQYAKVDEYNYPWWVYVTSIGSVLVFFFTISFFSGRSEAQNIITTTEPTVVKECFDCLKAGKFSLGVKYGSAFEVPKGRYFVPIGELSPVQLDRIDVLAVHPSHSDNPRYGFDTRKVYLVVYSDVLVTNLLKRPFSNWETLAMSLCLGLLVFGIINAMETRRLRRKYVKGISYA